MGSSQSAPAPTVLVYQVRTTRDTSSPEKLDEFDGDYAVCGRFNGHDFLAEIYNENVMFFDNGWKLGPKVHLDQWLYFSDSSDSNAVSPPTGIWKRREANFGKWGGGDKVETKLVSQKTMAIGNRIGSNTGVAWCARGSAGASSKSSESRGGVLADWNDFLKSYHHLEGELRDKCEFEGYEIIAVKRAQDQLSGVDIVWLHGYVILALESTQGHPRRFLRIDWTDGGFEIEENDNPEKFQSYMDRHPGEVQEGQNTVSKVQIGLGSGALALVLGGLCVSSMPALVTLQVGGTALGCGAVGSHHMQTTAAKAAKDEVFVTVNAVGKPSGVLKDLLCMLRKTRTANKVYDLATWNCNHVANAIFERLLLPGDAASP